MKKFSILISFALAIYGIGFLVVLADSFPAGKDNWLTAILSRFTDSSAEAQTVQNWIQSSPTPTPSYGVTPTPSYAITATPTPPTYAMTPTPSCTIAPTATPTPSTYVITPTPSPSPPGYKTPTPTPSITPTPTTTPSITPTPTVTPTPYGYKTPTPTPTGSPTPFGYKTPTPSPTPITMITSTPSAPTPVPIFTHWYLPAGGTLINGFVFDEYVLVANPGLSPVEVDLTFVDKDGPIYWYTQTIGPQSRYTVRVNNLPGCYNQPAISTIVDSLSGDIMCERSMYWNPGGIDWGGGHNSIGISRAAVEWDLPEGATHIFDEYVHVLNPDSDFTGETAEVRATFMNQFGDTWYAFTEVGPETNWTIYVNEEVGIQSQISTHVESENGVPIAVERTMYWDMAGVEWIDGHCSIGTSTKGLEWYLAEGATHIFDEYLEVSNPSETDQAQVTFNFHTKGGGGSTFFSHTVGPQTRYTLKVNNLLGKVDQVSAVVKSPSGIPIMVERAMYWTAGGIEWAGGHNSIANSVTACKWYFPEGATHIFDEYIIILNPDHIVDAEVLVTFMDKYGHTWLHNHIIGPQTRYTINVKNIVGIVDQVSTLVESTNLTPIVAERSMYWNPPPPDGTHWGSGHSTIGIPRP